MLLLDDGHCLRDQALSFCARSDAHETDFRATSLPTLAQMVSAGAGVTLLPELSLETEARPSAWHPPLHRPGPAPDHRAGVEAALAAGRALRQLAGAMRAAYPTARERSGSSGTPAGYPTVT